MTTVGSVCSGIEAASVAWRGLPFSIEWLSEIADFPCRLLSEKYPNVKNLGNMTEIPELLEKGNARAPDLICGGTPCQAFSLAGWKNGLNDDRGNLTLSFVDIIATNDKLRLAAQKKKTIVFWENVEGVLTDKTNAFGCLVSSLAGLPNPIDRTKWPAAGLVEGPERNVAWRVLDAKFFGVPQQRRRLYLLAGGKDFHPELVLFERHGQAPLASFPKNDLVFDKNGHRFEVFREYTDCLYSAYGTKWNGNAAAYNGSLFVVQDGRLRRLCPLECERLMGFPDNYTNLEKAKKTNRYQGTGNSWVVPVVKWLGERIANFDTDHPDWPRNLDLSDMAIAQGADFVFYSFERKGPIIMDMDFSINCTPTPEHCTFGRMQDIVCPVDDEDLYISPTGCYGILRRTQERNMNINRRLKTVLETISSTVPLEEIEKRSRVQKRGAFSR